MKQWMRSAALGLAVAGIIPTVSRAADAPATQPATGQGGQGQADVPVKVVVLFSSGVGYFEHYGQINNDARTELRFKTQQINDILKSLVLQDLDGGKVSTITYPSQDPISKTLRSFQVDITSNPSLADLLNQLRGAKVTVSIGDKKIAGTILGVEKKPKAMEKDKPPVEVPVLNLISGASIQSVEINEAKEIVLEDAELQQELAKALTALAQARDQDKKLVTINFSGQGQRRVRLGYVVETPIWKTSYRLILDAGAAKEGAAGGAATKPAEGGEEFKDGKLQGWAIVENQTDNDWNNVQLSLVSGRPISFIEDLYQPLYIARPVVQPQLFASLRPQTYDDGLDMDRLAKAGDMKLDLRKETKDAAGSHKRGAAMDRDGAEEMEKQLQENGAPSERRNFGGGAGAAPGKPMDPSASVASIASASKVGELFQYTVGNVSLPRQRSAMIPIITDDIEVERLSIYNAGVLQKNPLNGARVKNTTGKHLLQGPITVLDGGVYAGDAQIDNLPPGQERLLSYGIDLQMLVNSTSNSQTSNIESAKIVKGVLSISRKTVFSQDYAAENKGEKSKTLIIEHPLRQGWTLLEPKNSWQKTDTLYRFKDKVEPAKPFKLTVKEQIVQAEAIAILPADVGQLDWYSKNGEISKEVKDALAGAIKLKQAMVDTQRQIGEEQQKIQIITQEQARIRENMKTVAQNSDYYNRLAKKLNDQETDLEARQKNIEELQKKYNSQREELEKYLNELTVG